MAEVDIRYIAFENDHTYLKTKPDGKEDIQIVQTNISPIGTNNNVLLDPPPTDSQQMTVHATKNKTFSVQRVNIGNKSTVRQYRPIQPKITNDMKMNNTTQAQSNLFLPPSTNTTVIKKIPTVKLRRLEKPPKHTKSIVPNILPEKPVVKPIKKKTKFVFRFNIKELKKELANNYKNGECLKDKVRQLSPSLLKSLQNGEKLFMCIECDKIYTEHKDILDHQIIHKKSDEKTTKPKTEIRENLSENSLDTNLKKCTTIESKKKKNNDNNKINKQIKPTTKTKFNPNKPKTVIEGFCTICNLLFPDLQKHVRTLHQTHPRDFNKDNINQFNCNYYSCNMEFDDQLQLRAHELATHKAINYIYNCEQCCKDFLCKEELEAHTKTHHNENKKYLCPYCDVGFPYSNGLKNHLVKHINLNSSENSNTNIATNQIEQSPIKPIKSKKSDQLFADSEKSSNDCNEVYFEQDAHDKYRVRFSTNNVVKSASLPLDSLVDGDIKVDVELNNVSLEDNTNTTINKQQTTAVSKNRVSSIECRLCLMVVTYSSIGKHMKEKHNNAAPYKCDLCHAEFNHKPNMDDHQRKHTNTKPYKCINCSKCYYYKQHLSRHMMRVHNSDSLKKLFKCSVCDKAFLFSESLTIHNNNHHKPKRYKCQICGQSFPTNATIKMHQLCHTDERPYMCEHCGRTFKFKKNYDTHAKNLHPRNQL